MIGYPTHAAALAASVVRMAGSDPHRARRAAALHLDDGSYAAGLGYTCGEELRRRAGQLPDGRHERFARDDDGAPWRLVQVDGPRVHWLERAGSQYLWDRVPLRYAVTLTWSRPPGRGPWLLIERGVRSYLQRGDAGYVDGISDGGAILRRYGSEDDARKEMRVLYLEACRRLLGVRHEVVHESAVAMVETGQPYGCALPLA